MELAFELALNKLHVNRKYVHVYHIDMIKFADTNYVTCHHKYISFCIYMYAVSIGVWNFTHLTLKRQAICMLACLPLMWTLLSSADIAFSHVHISYRACDGQSKSNSNAKMLSGKFNVNSEILRNNNFFSGRRPSRFRNTHYLLNVVCLVKLFFSGGDLELTVWSMALTTHRPPSLISTDFCLVYT